MGFKNIMGTIDPVAGVTTGEGLAGKIQSKTLMVDPVAELMARSGDKRKKGLFGVAKNAYGMKKGGEVKRPRDGMAKRGKTKGRMC